MTAFTTPRTNKATPADTHNHLGTNTGTTVESAANKTTVYTTATIGRTPTKETESVNLHEHLQRQSLWSEKTFGPGHRTAGVLDHIRKELTEIEDQPLDLTEWIDVVILAFDGAWRTGATPAEIVSALEAKQSRNESRDWPDWRTAPPDQAIEHVRHSVDEL